MIMMIQLMPCRLLASVWQDSFRFQDKWFEGNVVLTKFMVPEMEVG